jgi:cytochrome c biogenesis protein CcdA/thiol-disulfide isomerase/thioredoxin
MILLIIFAFLAGVVTILSPCILPVLPIILSSSVGGKNSSKDRPLGIVTGFVLSFTFFTLFLSSIVKATGIPAESLRLVSVGIIAVLGLALLFPQFQIWLELIFAKLSRHAPKGIVKPGFGPGLLLGLSLGLLWTPCVGPILASVISLAISGTVNNQAILITLAYSVGTAVPMFIIILGGRKYLTRFPQKLFGVIMILTAAAIYFNFDRQFQSYILDKFPNYGTGLTKFEEKASLKSMTITPAPEISAGGQWFNSDPLTLKSLKGKVILIDFWTYSCINCQRTFPYLKTWWEKYQEQGLVIIGVHSPEYEFEKDPDNVAKAIEDFDLTYPIVQDNDFDTWQAYQNRYWPAKYLIDKNGQIRYTHFGEGDYDETEAMIQKLLSVSQTISNPDYQIYSRTPEIYLGKARAVPSDYLRFSGNWQQTEEYAQASTGAALTLSFEAKDVFLVMNPVDQAAVVEVQLDGQKLDSVKVDSDRLYRLVNLPEPGRHTLELLFPDGNIQAYAFTFG